MTVKHVNLTSVGMISYRDWTN